MAGNFALGLQAGAPVGQAAVNAYLGTQRNTRENEEAEQRKRASEQRFQLGEYELEAHKQNKLDDEAVRGVLSKWKDMPEEELFNFYNSNEGFANDGAKIIPQNTPKGVMLNYVGPDGNVMGQKPMTPEVMAQVRSRMAEQELQYLSPAQFAAGQKTGLHREDMAARNKHQAEQLAATKEHYERMDENTKRHYDNEAKRIGMASGLQAFQLQKLKEADTDMREARQLGLGLPTMYQALGEAKTPEERRRIESAIQGVQARLEVLNPKVGFSGGGLGGRAEKPMMTFEKFVESPFMPQRKEGESEVAFMRRAKQTYNSLGEDPAAAVLSGIKEKVAAAKPADRAAMLEELRKKGYDPLQLGFSESEIAPRQGLPRSSIFSGGPVEDSPAAKFMAARERAKASARPGSIPGLVDTIREYK